MSRRNPKRNDRQQPIPEIPSDAMFFDSRTRHSYGGPGVFSGDMGNAVLVATEKTIVVNGIAVRAFP